LPDFANRIAGAINTPAGPIRLPRILDKAVFAAR
jgi:hypothetical protein